MERFIVPANELVGTFPDCFGEMVKLEELHITGNFLESLPRTLYSLPDLTRLSLSSNDFGGNIGNLWSGAQEWETIFPKLETLDLHSNRLTGQVPDEKLAQITTLKAINFVNNPGLRGSLDDVCSTVSVFLAVADCDISCSCCKYCQ
jgi:hypothetical protein